MSHTLPTYRLYVSSSQERRVVFIALPKNGAEEFSKLPEGRDSAKEKGEEKPIEAKKETEKRVIQAKTTQKLLKGRIHLEAPKPSKPETSSSTIHPKRPETQQERMRRLRAEENAREGLMQKFNTYVPRDSWEYLRHLKEEEQRLLTPDKMGRVGTGYFPDVYQARLALVREMIQMQEEIIRVYEKVLGGRLEIDARTGQRKNSIDVDRMGIVRAMPDRHIAITETREPSLVAAAFGGRRDISFEEFRQWNPQNLPEGQKSLFERRLKVQDGYAILLGSIETKINCSPESPFNPFKGQFRQIRSSLRKIWDRTQEIKNVRGRVDQMEFILAETGPKSIRAEIHAFTDAAARQANAEAQAAIARYNAIADSLLQVADIAYAVEFTLVQTFSSKAAIGASLAYNLSKLSLGEIDGYQCALYLFIDTFLAYVPIGAVAQKIVVRCCEKPAVEKLLGSSITKMADKLLKTSTLDETAIQSITRYLVNLVAKAEINSVLCAEIRRELGYR